MKRAIGAGRAEGDVLATDRDCYGLADRRLRDTIGTRPGPANDLVLDAAVVDAILGQDAVDDAGEEECRAGPKRSVRDRMGIDLGRRTFC